MDIAINVRLQGIGIILWPTENGCAPRYINVEQFYFMSRYSMMFIEIDGPIYNYKRDRNLLRWELSAIDARTNRRTD